MKHRLYRCLAVVLGLAMLFSLAACGSAQTEAAAQTPAASSAEFTDRDLSQEADLTDATEAVLTDGSTLTIETEGVYTVSGSAKNAQIIVDAPDDAKVQLVLDGLTVENDSTPVVYVKSADKVFVTTAEGSDNRLSVTGAFTADGDTNTDAVIFSKDDLVLNGLGALQIESSDNGVSCKDELKITGGTLTVDAASDALEANDAISVADGTLTITAGKDGLHAENDEDDSVGSITILGGTLDITAQSDGIQGTTLTEISGGTITVTAAEGIEGTCVRISGGDITISASDDGVNASAKSSALTPSIEISGGALTVTMAQGDTDAIDSNGSIVVSGGTVNITAQFAFDFVTGAEHTGGTITVNGQTVDEITASMMGGPGGMQGGPGQMPGGPGGRHP